MKLNHLLLVLVFLCQTLHAQEIETIGSYKKPKNFSQTHDTYLHGDQVLLNYSPYVPVANLNLIAYGLYQNANLQENGTFIDKKIPTKEGIIQESFYSGDTITEFIIYYSKGFPKYECKYAIRMRNLKTMEVFGEEKILATYEFMDIAEYQSMRLLSNGIDYAFVESLKTECKITFISRNLEINESLKLNRENSPSYYYNAIYNKDGSILLNYPNVKTNKLTNWDITHITKDGVINSFSTSQDLSDIDLLLMAKFSYDDENQTVSLIYQYKTHEKITRHGIAIEKWKTDGSLVFTNNSILDFETIFKNEPQIAEEFKSKKIDPEKIWSETNFCSLEYKKYGEDEYLFIKRPTLYPSQFSSALYILKLDSKTGEILWIKPVLSNILWVPQKYSPLTYYKDGKLHVFFADLTVNSKNHEHINNPFIPRSGDITFFDLTLNSEDGSEESNDQLDFTISADNELNTFYIDQKNLLALIGFTEGKMITYRKVNFK